MFYRGSVLSFIIIVLLSSCEIINPSEDIPAYLHVTSMTLNVKNGEGSESQKIIDAWVAIDKNLIGVYELPATFPILEEGEHEIQIGAGILDNGITGTRVEYDFYTSYNINYEFTPGITDSISPIIEYSELADFVFIENFDGTGVKFERKSGNVNITQTSSNGFEDKCGLIELDDANNFMEIVSTEKFQLPSDGNPVYLELNYYSSNTFQIGLLNELTQDRFYNLVVSPKNEWNKIYVNLTEQATTLKALEYRLLFQSYKTDSLTSAEIRFDNIKLIH